MRVEDILEAIERISRYTAGMNEAAFVRDEKTVDAVIRNLTVIGEAARFIGAEVEAEHTHIPWANMRGFRNIVVHEYFGVSTAIVWQTVQANLPPLIPELRRLLEASEEV